MSFLACACASHFVERMCISFWSKRFQVADKFLERSLQNFTERV